MLPSPNIIIKYNQEIKWFGLECSVNLGLNTKLNKYIPKWWDEGYWGIYSIIYDKDIISFLAKIISDIDIISRFGLSDLNQ